MLWVPGPTFTCWFLSGAKEFPDTSTSRSPTLPSSHWGHMITPMPPVRFMKLPETVPPIDLKWMQPQDAKVLSRTTAPPLLSLSTVCSSLFVRL